jgi:hypothetical protein
LAKNGEIVYGENVKIALDSRIAVWLFLSLLGEINAISSDRVCPLPSQATFLASSPLAFRGNNYTVGTIPGLFVRVVYYVVTLRPDVSYS